MLPNARLPSGESDPVMSYRLEEMTSPGQHQRRRFIQRVGWVTTKKTRSNPLRKLK